MVDNQCCRPPLMDFDLSIYWAQRGRTHAVFLSDGYLFSFFPDDWIGTILSLGGLDI